MSRLYTDSCGDHYNTSTAILKWDQINNLSVVSNIPGMTNNCILMQTPGGQSASFARKNLPSSYTALIAGMRLRLPGLPITNSKPLTCWWDAGNQQITLYVNSAGAISAWVGDNSGQPDSPAGTMIASTATGIIRPATNFYLEWDVAFVHASATGSITIRVNSLIAASASSVVTANFSGTANQFSILPGDANNWNGAYYDDIYVNSTINLGDGNTGFDGDQQVLVRLPAGAGASTQWSIGGSIPAATNWQSVNEVPPDADVTLVSAGSSGLVDLYTISPLPGSVVTVTDVQMLLDSKTDASGLGAGATIAPVLGDGGIHTPNVGTSVSRNTDYNYVIQNYGTNPLTGVAWIPADFNVLQIGQKRTA